MNIFKQEKPGVWKSNYDDDGQWVKDTAPGVKILAKDILGNDGVAEIIMKTRDKIALYVYDQAYGMVRKRVESNLSDFGSGIPWTTLAWRDFDAGDADGDGIPEIVMAVSFRPTPQGEDHEYLILLEVTGNSTDLALERTALYDLYTRIKDFSIGTLRLGNYDADDRKEIWIAGWQNHFERDPDEFDQRIYCWQINGLTLDKLEEVDVDGPEDSLTLGPYICLGDLLGGAGDEIVVQRRDPQQVNFFPHHVEILQRGTGSFSVPVAQLEYPDRRVSSMKIADRKLFIAGFVPYVERSNAGFLEFFGLEGSGGTSSWPFASTFYRYFATSEVSVVAAGKGMVVPRVCAW